MILLYDYYLFSDFTGADNLSMTAQVYMEFECHRQSTGYFMASGFLLRVEF